MGKTTGISWTDATWNPIRGCSRVSEGCRNCYAEKVAYRFSGPGQAYEGLVRIGADGKRRPEWAGQIAFVEKHLLNPLRWKKTPMRIFVNSMSDLFHENVTDAMRDRIFAVMALCPQHAFQVLTKRPERMLAYLSAHGRTSNVYNAAALMIGGDWSRMSKQMAHHRSSGEGWWPLPNVWLGVSVEDQKTADARIPLLLQTPGAVRFISAEPLLGHIDLFTVPRPDDAYFRVRGEKGVIGPKQEPDDYVYWQKRLLHWVIVGGESGPGARPMHPDWARSLRDQCAAAGVPFFFKQWGEWIPFSDPPALKAQHPNLADSAVVGLLKQNGAFVRPYTQLDAPGQQMCRVGTKAAGDLLDGKQWHEFPPARLRAGGSGVA